MLRALGPIRTCLVSHEPQVGPQWFKECCPPIQAIFGVFDYHYQATTGAFQCNFKHIMIQSVGTGDSRSVDPRRPFGKSSDLSGTGPEITCFEDNLMGIPLALLHVPQGGAMKTPNKFWSLSHKSHSDCDLI